MTTRKSVCWLGLVLLLAAGLLAPGAGFAQGDQARAYAMKKEQLLKNLNLTPEKIKEFQAVEVKFQQSRKEIVDRLGKSEADLEKALTAPQVDEGKVKELVAAITADHNQLMETFKTQRQEEMALLTPAQQGKYLLLLRGWHKQMRKK